MSFIYKIHRIPAHDPVLAAFLAGKLASLRLQALTVSSAAFGGQFVLGIFSRMPYTLWIERLLRPKFHTFVAVSYPEDTAEDQQTVDKGQIVGTATLIGPIPAIEYNLPSLDGVELTSDNEESKWHCTALYCSPDIRGKGVGNLLINARIEFAKASSEVRKVRIRVLVHPHNPKVLEPLKLRGFLEAGKCTALEAIPASGDDILLSPEGRAGISENLHAAVVFVMELKTHG